MGRRSNVVVVRRVVEQHQAGANRIAKIEHVEARGRLVETIAIPSRVESEKAAEHQADGGLVRHDQHTLARMSIENVTNSSQGTRN